MALEDQIIQSIRSGDVKMRPRWYFVLRSILAVLAIVIVLLITIFFMSFIVFILRQTGAWFVPVFGISGWYSLFLGLPWVLVGLSALFVVILAILVKRYPLGYQWPVVYSLLGIFFLIVSMSFLFIRSSFYHGLFDSQMSREIPLLDDYYPGIGVLVPRDVRRGTIEQIDQNGFVLGDINNHTSSIFVVSSTNFPLGNDFHLGDVVVIFGEPNVSGTIQAVGIEDLSTH